MSSKCPVTTNAQASCVVLFGVAVGAAAVACLGFVQRAPTNAKSRAWYGTHHHYSVAWTPLYVAEACYKYNNRDDKDIFWKFLTQAMMV